MTLINHASIMLINILITLRFHVIAGVGLPLMMSHPNVAGSPSFTIKTPFEGTDWISGATEKTKA